MIAPPPAVPSTPQLPPPPPWSPSRALPSVFLLRLDTFPLLHGFRNFGRELVACDGALEIRLDRRHLLGSLSGGLRLLSSASALASSMRLARLRGQPRVLPPLGRRRRQRQTRRGGGGFPAAAMSSLTCALSTSNSFANRPASASAVARLVLLPPRRHATPRPSAVWRRHPPPRPRRQQRRRQLRRWRRRLCRGRPLSRGGKLRLRRRTRFSASETATRRLRSRTATPRVHAQFP